MALKTTSLIKVSYIKEKHKLKNRKAVNILTYTVNILTQTVKNMTYRLSRF